MNVRMWMACVGTGGWVDRLQRCCLELNDKKTKLNPHLLLIVPSTASGSPAESSRGISRRHRRRRS